MTNFGGTPEYLAPELLNSSAGKFTEASDVWALGVIFHKMLSNNVHPFIEKSEESATNRELNLTIIMENIGKNKLKISQKIVNPLYLSILKGFF